MIPARGSYARRFTGCAALILFFVGLASSQTIYGTLNGRVVDVSGAVIPNAKIIIKNTATGAIREVVTDQTGFWRAPSLLAGQYTVTAQVQSFETVVRGPLTVEAQVERSIDITLSPGSTTEVVSIVAESPLIEVSQAQVTKTVDARQILELPGLNSRDGIALLQPGVAPNNNGRPGSGFVVNGARSRSNNFTIDGANNNDQSLQIPRQNLPPEALGQFSIITNQFSAEFGRNAGAQVSQFTRSGTNEFHGILRWQWAGNGLDSLTTGQQRTFNSFKSQGLSDFDSLRRSRGVTVQNDISGGVGGPIIKNRAFFYANYDNSLFRTSSVPTPSVSISPAGMDLLRANQGSFAPGVVQFLEKAYPVASDPTPRGTTNVTLPDGRVLTVPFTQINPGAAGAIPYGTDFHRGLIRGDVKVSDNDTLSARWVVDDSQDPGAPTAIPINQVGGINRNNNITANYVRTWSPNIVSEARYTYADVDRRFPENQSTAFTTTGLTGIGNQNFPQFRNDYLQEATGIVRQNIGRHSIRYGGNYLYYNLNSFFAPNSRGLVQYNSLADLLFDRNATFSRYAGTGTVNAITHETGLYFQDDWRVASNVTLNLGIRYEFTSAPFGFFSNAKADTNNWAPRVGFAWAPKGGSWLTGNGRLSIRGGYGIAYDQIFQNILLNNARNFPRGVSLVQGNLSGQRFYEGVLDPSKQPAVQTPQQFTGDPNLLPVRLYSPNKRLSQPYSQQFSLGVERQLGNQYAFRIFYIGTRGLKLVREVESNIGFFKSAVDANPAVYQSIIGSLKPTTFSGQAAFRVDPTKGSILVGDGIAASTYHSLQTTLEKRFSSGLQFELNYTWSSFINDSDDILGGQANATLPSVPFNYRNDRGRSGFDQPHRFVGNFLYEMPKVFENRAVLSRIFSGYQLNGVVTMNTGTPYSILNANNALGILPGQISTVEGSQRANINLSGDPLVGTNAGANAYWVANLVNSGIIGTSGRNIVRTGDTYNFNSALAKNIPLWSESTSLQFRWEVFNVFNHRNFVTNPANTVSNATNNALFRNLGQTNVGGRTMNFLVRIFF
jgi:outer membrane receptor protein involved in Fe transport